MIFEGLIFFGVVAFCCKVKSIISAVFFLEVSIFSLFVFFSVGGSSFVSITVLLLVVTGAIFVLSVVVSVVSDLGSEKSQGLFF